jgi:CheY-like chemotaxis protein
MTAPLLLAFVPDLYFSMRIESAAGSLGYDVEIIEQGESGETGENLGEALQGSQGDLIQMVSARLPGLIIFDLSASQIPWAQWIARLKSAPATRRIPLIAFGQHEDVDTLTAAKEAGAEAVYSRNIFANRLPHLLQKHIRIADTAAIEKDCTQPLSDLARVGIGLFNAGKYFEAHEALEHAWNEDEGAAKELYRAILQVAVAYLQIERGNYRGAVKMFLRVRQWFAPLPDKCRGVDVAQLRADAGAVERALMALGEAQVAAFDQGLFRPVITT